MPSYVITGGLGAGKTSVIEALGGTVATVPEPAREVIARHRALTGEGTMDNRPALFVERLVSRSLRDFRSAPINEITVFDRGLPDCVAYAAVYEVDPTFALRAATDNLYANPVFVAPPWEEIYTNDDMRTATFAEAEAFYAEVVGIYERLGYELIEIPRASVERRRDWVASHLS